MPDIPFAGLLPPAVHRRLLRVAEIARRRWWAWRKPRLRGCAIVATNPEGEVLMVRHSYRKRLEWHVLTGGIRRGEDAELAARRELAEEVAVSPITMAIVHVEEIDLHGARNEVTVFAATICESPRADGREIAELAFFGPDDLPPTTPAWARNYIAKALAG